jgi:hypothetical protein
LAVQQSSGGYDDDDDINDKDYGEGAGNAAPTKQFKPTKVVLGDGKKAIATTTAEVGGNIMRSKLM